MIEMTLPIKLVSPNIQEHWTKRHKRNKSNDWTIRANWLKMSPIVYLPCIVVLTRLAPRKYDEDNLIASFKGVRDSIADLLNPGLAKGQADSSKDIEWQYKQERSKTIGIRIQIKPLIPDPIIY